MVLLTHRDAWDRTSAAGYSLKCESLGWIVVQWDPPQADTVYAEPGALSASCPHCKDVDTETVRVHA